ncbi:hypothetical protein N177_4105 [Lutibaculum baratangense AMV1]|uniref:Uncharacterized protein n=1 Tax=Lutibaculum baratangense AMV1 TaxID=631454 RepID=V4RGX1_9HYPH|nr:hypothetical protein N177_4105 [Lutibaculum baratangense AMV1]
MPEGHKSHQLLFCTNRDPSLILVLQLLDHHCQLPGQANWQMAAQNDPI